MTTQAALATCRMVTALWPLQPSATSLLRRSLFLRPTRCHLPVCHKVNHGSSTHKFELHTAHAYAAKCSGSSNETAHVLGLARRALKQTIAPHSVVRRLHNVQLRQHTAQIDCCRRIAHVRRESCSMWVANLCPRWISAATAITWAWMLSGSIS